MSMTTARSRRFRAAVAAAALVTTTLGLPATPARAASSINVYWFMTDDQAGTPSDLWHNMWITVQLPMSEHDAQRHINNGARVEIMCYGDDTFFEEPLLRGSAISTGSTGGGYRLPGTVKTTLIGVNRLYANIYGVILTAIISGKHGDSVNTNLREGFNEDFGTDEVYCRATWVGADGARLHAFTGAVTGDF